MPSKEDLIKATIEIYELRRYKNDWCLGRATVSACKTGELKKGEEIRIKGVIPPIQEGNMYNVMIEMDDDPKWGLQYLVKSIFSAITFDENDCIGQKKFLSSIFTPLQIEAMYSALKDPYAAFLKNDVAQLLNVKGCGFKTADIWIRKFNANLSKAKIFTELESYNLTNNMIDRLMDRYGSPDFVISKVKENPYILCTEVKGIGWKTADKIALDGGIEPYSTKRIKAYMIHYMDQCGENGCSWITPDELMGAILEELGEDIPDGPITLSLRELIDDDIIWHSEDKSKIGLMEYYAMELLIAKELIRIRDAKSEISYSNLEETLKCLEVKQGWNFTEEQMNGIKTGLDNNVTVITGLAGTGKSSLVSGILEVLKDYSFVQTALSGKAASRLQEITGEEGFTIHRLLGFPLGDKQGFAYHDENPLRYDIYIIDEISMIDAKLFYYLLRAIPDGAKVYLLGDTGQLEAIGSGNIAYDMIHSEEIPTVQLTKIHRQAAKSAIITESIKARHGEQLIPKDWVGQETRGELQDLILNCYSDASKTFFEIMKTFSTIMENDDFDIMETQVIVPVKSRGTACTYELNNSIQDLYNPTQKRLREEVCFNNGKTYILREGDKVINCSNNYKVYPPIYNGNTGIIKGWEWDEDEDEEVMIVDFLGIGEVRLIKKFWNNIELAYALTTHKLQGSQSRYVIYGLDFSAYSLLTREQIYTALTRAKKKCYLIAQTGALRMAISKEAVSKKQTHLQKCLHDIAHPKLVF